MYSPKPTLGIKMIPDRYTYKNFKRAVRQPEKFVEELGRLPSTFHSVVQEGWANMNGLGENDAVRLIEEDWDNLIVIDACRADLFEEVVDTDRFDEYERKVSVDTNTTPWSIKNFKGERMGDTVYVNGNPATSKTIPDEFHRFIEVWTDRDAWTDPDDEGVEVLPPKPVFEAAVEASEEYPNKRLVVHFIQPHAPFIRDPQISYTKQWDPTGEGGAKDPNKPDDTWEGIRMGEVEPEDAWEGYKRNLEYVTPYVFDLIENLRGKTVLTSDHGNMMGERTVSGKRIYGHPGGFRCPELVEVPWCVVEGAERKEVTDDGVHSEGTVNSDLVNERLAALGYVE